MATKYVSFATGNDTTGDGTSGLPWKTLFKAASVSHAVGDVITFADGEYDETTQAAPISAGSIAGYVTYKATNVTPTSRPVTFHYGSNINLTAKFQANSMPYLWLEGFKFTQTARGTGSTRAGDRPVSIWTNSHYCVVRNVEAYEAVEPFKTYGTDYVTFDRCIGRLCEWAGGSFSARFTDWTGCTFSGFTASGLQIKGGSRDCKIHGCLTKVDIAATDVALYVSGVSSVDSGQLDLTIHETENCVAYSNIIFVESTGSIPYGIAVAGGKNTLVLNNTIVSNTQGKLANAAFHCRGGGTDWSSADGGANYTTDPKFINNIVHTATRGWQTNANGHKYTGTLTDTNNIIYNVGSQATPPSSTGPTGTPSSSGALTTDPLFTTLGANFAASNLRLQASSPGRATGVTTTLTGYYGTDIPVNRDYTGVLRTGTWDRGAYQDTIAAPPTGKSDYLEEKYLNWFFRAVSYTPPATFYVSLHTAAPGDIGSSEIAGNGYARASIAQGLTTWTAADDAGALYQVTNAIAIIFATPSGAQGTATHIGLWDASTAGNLLYNGELVAPLAIASGVAPYFPVGALSFTEG